MLYIFAGILGLMGGFALADAVHLLGPASEASALTGVLEICAGLFLSAIAFIAQKARQLVYLAHRQESPPARTRDSIETRSASTR
jgi:hypothetical protein